MTTTDPAVPPTPERPSVLRASVIGLGVGVALAATVFFVIAIPFYTLASFEPNGLDRPIVRTGLFRIAMPVGLVLGVVCGAVTGRWLRQGGRWTAPDGHDRYSDRYTAR